MEEPKPTLEEQTTHWYEWISSKGNGGGCWIFMNFYGEDAPEEYRFEKGVFTLRSSRGEYTRWDYDPI